MCAIAGIFHPHGPKPVESQRVERMCAAMAHRGPDGAGVWTGPGIALGHRRLSVIDPQGSPQPMASSDGRAVISFNGEIYNYRELRGELERGGARFATKGDTEVILAAWRRWGTGCLGRLEGMFAFALWDSDKRQLLLARDRLGVKPLYLAQLTDGSLAFASELKGVLAHPLLRRRLSHRAIDDYLAWGYVPDHGAILEGVGKLAAGHYLLLEQGKPVARAVRWWEVDFTSKRRESAADLKAELLHRLKQAVLSRMVSDVPLGAFLSGGVDSSSVVALMAQLSARPIKTFSIGFETSQFDESEYACAVADRFGSDHTCRIVDPQDFSQADRLAAIFDEPFADASALASLRLCELAREKVKVALSGDGADEAFAGYRRQIFFFHEARLRRLIPAGLRSSVFGPLGAFWPKADWAPRALRAKATLIALSVNDEDAYAQALSIAAAGQRANLYGDGLRRAIGDYRAEDRLAATMREASARTALDRALYADLKFWLPGDILAKVDRTSMAVGLEAREPLLDHRLVEFAAQLPDRLRVRGGQGKVLLKQAMRAYLPDDILYRPKQGFVTPIAQWLRGPLSTRARALARSEILLGDGLFDARAIARIAEEHIAGRFDHSRILWQLLMLEKSLARLLA